MPRKASTKKTYTQAQKLAYYKKKAARAYGGRGEYTAPKSAKVGRQIGETIGSAVGFIPGMSALAAPISQLTGKLGNYLGNKLGSYFGWGAYSVNRNSLVVPEGQSPAYMHSSGATNRVCHREYIGDVISSSVAGQFNIQSFPIQPGARDIFPWLSPIALQYQKYKLLGAIVEFKSGSGDAITGANTALGEVIISTNYNCADPNFISRNQMENTMYCSSAKPSVSFVHVIECDPTLQAQESLYVSPSVVPENTGNSVNEINWCNVQVATIGCQGTSVNLGSLYVTYEVELIQPVELSDARQPRGDMFSLVASTINNANPLGSTLPTPDPKNSLGGSVISSTRYAFPPNLSSGLFLVSYYIQGAATVITMPAPAVTNGISPTIFYNDTFQRLVVPNTGISSTCCGVTFMVQISGRGCLIDIPAGGTLNTAPTMGVFYVQTVDASFNTPLATKRKDKRITYTDHGEIIEFIDHEEMSPSLIKTPVREEYEQQRQECEQRGDSYTIDKLRRKLKELESQL